MARGGRFQCRWASTTADHSPDVWRSSSTSGRRNPATSEHCEGEMPLTASHPPGATRRTSSGASSTSAARPTFATTTSNASSISASGARVASTCVLHAVEGGVASGRVDGVGLEVGGHDARRPESQRAQPEHAAAAPDVQDSLATLDPRHQLFDHQPRRGMLATSEAPDADLDQPRHVSAIVLGPRKAHAEPIPERERAGVAHPRLEADPGVGSGHRHHPLGAQRRGERTSLPLVIHGYEYQPSDIAGCHDLHRSHPALADPGTHTPRFRPRWSRSPRSPRQAFTAKPWRPRSTSSSV